MRYEISEFIAKIRGTGEKSYKLTPEESISITGIVEKFVKSRNIPGQRISSKEGYLL